MTRQEKYGLDFDPEIAAFIDLMVETEAIAEHEQMTFIEHNVCGTSACIAGHASLRRFKGDAEAAHDNHDAAVALLEDVFGLDGVKSPFMSEWDLTPPTKKFAVCIDAYVVAEFDEDQALRNYRRLCHFAATEEEWETFQDLTSLDPEDLRARALA